MDQSSCRRSFDACGAGCGEKKRKETVTVKRPLPRRLRPSAPFRWCRAFFNRRCGTGLTTCRHHATSSNLHSRQTETLLPCLSMMSCCPRAARGIRRDRGRTSQCCVCSESCHTRSPSRRWSGGLGVHERVLHQRGRLIWRHGPVEH